MFSYIDEGVLRCPVEEVKSDVINLERAANEISLFLNHDKSEIIICNDEKHSLSRGSIRI